MKKNLIKLFLFGFASLFVVTNEVMAENQTINVDISYGTVLNFIPGTKYDGVKCNIPGDTGDFIFTDTDYSDDHYVEVKNPNAVSGSITIDCSYSKKKSHSGSNVPVTSTNGVDTFIFNIVEPKDLSKFNMELHRQFRYFVDMKTYFTIDANSGVSSITLTGDLLKVFENSNGSVACNTQSCTLYLKQDAKVGISVGKIKYGNHEFELTVDVKDEWVVYADTGGYGKCDFEKVGGGWELNANNSNYFEKAISGKTVALPNCQADNTFGNRYLALEFVGWVYNKKTDNANYNNYQSVDVCATFKDNSNPNVGFISGGSSFAPSEMTYDYRGNSVFYACYKRTGIGFNLYGAKVIDDTYQITKWNLTQREGDVTPGIYYKVFDDSVKTIKLPSEVEPAELAADEVFVGWAHNNLGYNGTNPEVLIPGGTEVSVEEGLIYTPQFMRQKTETEKNVTVYVRKKLVVDLPQGFVCTSLTRDNYSIVGTGNRCVITGITSTNGEYLTESIKSNNKTFTLKIQIVEGAYSEGDDVPGVEIGNGDLILDPGDGTSNVSTKIPADCDSYIVGRFAEGSVKSADVFTYKNIYAQTNPGSITYNGHIFTYYARSNCAGDNNFNHETEYAALCLDPGRAAPPRSDTYKTVGNKSFQGTKYKFFRYINVNDEVLDYRQFSQAVAFIVNKIGNVPLATFNEANYTPKLAANIALRIIATQFPNIFVPPVEGDSGRDEVGDSVISYYNAYYAYQTMAMHLKGRIGTNEYRVEAFAPDESKCAYKLSDGRDNHERSYYMSCNKEWIWKDGTEVLQQTIADYLSYAYLGDFSNSNWEVTPELEVTSRNGNRMELLLTYPRNINFRYDNDGNYAQFGGYDVTLNISPAMSKIYQISEGALKYGTNDHLSCLEEVDGYCVRYKVYMLPDLTQSDSNYARHQIILDFVVSDTAEIAFPDPSSRDIYLEVGYSSAYTSESAFMVEPDEGSASIQRMILFNPEKVTKVFPLNMYDCSILLEQHGNNKSMYEKIYRAGCCETISDGTTEYQEFVNTYCKRDCVMNNYKPICESSDTVTDYKIKEAMTKSGDINYSCIVDVVEPTSLSVDQQIAMINGTAVTSPSPYANTSAMTDITGENSIAISSYNNNPYCRVTCKEDWEFNMPGYGDFLGSKAVAAGSLFQINHSINLRSSVTCVTSYIDIPAYEDALEKLSTEINDAYEKYSFRAAAVSDIEVSYTDKGTWYTYDVELKACGASEFDSNGQNPAASSCSWNTSYWNSCNVEHIGEGTCKITGSYTVNPNATCTKANSSSSDCVVGGTYTYTRACTYADGSAGGCRPRPIIGCRGTGEQCTTWENGGSTYTGTKNCTNGDSNHDGCTVTHATDTCDTVAELQKSGCGLEGGYYHPCSYSDVLDTNNTNCHFNGNYKYVKQVTHSDAGSDLDSSCYVYKIVTTDSTKINTFETNGNNKQLRSHSGINGVTHSGAITLGYAQTEYSSGTSDVCSCNGSDCNCKKSDTTVVSSYSCEVNENGNKTNSGYWQSHLLDNHTRYAGDTNLIKTNIETYYRILNSKQETLSKVVNKFATCQNFYVNNTSTQIVKPTKIYNGAAYYSLVDANSDKVLSITGTPYNINTKFDPAGTFGYDEQYYMDLMGAKREIAYDGNGIITSSSSGMYNRNNVDINTFKACYGTTGKYDAGGTSIDCSTTLNSGYYETSGYDFNANLLTNFTYVLCDLGTLNYEYGAEDKCAPSMYYYYNANYMKKTLNSAANYDNNVTWYRYLVNDKIYPAVGFANELTKRAAASRLKDTEYNPNDWSVMGTKNVFPVSLTTRRNIYQYYYSFKGIGNYFNNSRPDDRKNIGRIMGYQDSVVESNSRVCFYEVYESACICCGKNDLGPTSQVSKVDSYKYVSNYKKSEFADGSGRYGFTTSTVSLYNLEGFSSNTSGSNWSAGDHYFYNGNGNYKTDKGKELAEYIEQKGENVYAEMPEYSYVLTPNAMANIRKYNSSATYGYGKNTVYQLPGYAYLAHSNNKDHSFSGDVADRIIFTHFGSNFVKDLLIDYETPEYKGKLMSTREMSKECYVEDGNVSNLSNIKNCKWIDYVQPVNPDNTGGYFRMAFK